MKSVLQCERDKSCQQLLAAKWPNVERIDDVKKIKKVSADIICGGFPCQDLSIAGRRKGLAGERSGLWFEFARIIKSSLPRWVVIENVPGLLSSAGGKDFQTLIKSLVTCGYGVSWRILDSRYFGVAQRRRRVFIVGSLGDGSSAKVLFESKGLQRYIAKGQEAGQDPAAYAVRLAQTSSNGWGVREEETGTLDNTGGGAIVASTINASLGHHGRSSPRGDGGDNLVVGKSLSSRNQRIDYETETLLPMAFTASEQSNAFAWEKPYTPALDAQVPNDTSNIQKGVRTVQGVRRLTPTECERLQGFPDGWTGGFADSTRYKMLGNAVTVSVIRWLGKRIMLQDAK
jgi:DNA (cytosine-5)-methyltransferase 1